MTEAAETPIFELPVIDQSVIDSASPEVSRLANSIGYALAERGVKLTSDDTFAAAQRLVDQGLVAADVDKPRRHTAPIRRLHADGSFCEHKVSSSGKPREGEDCPGVHGYRSACSCGWSTDQPIRAYVEELRGHHMRKVHAQ